MTEQVLDILKLVLLALLYLFFGRVLWAVWSEVRTPVNNRGAAGGPVPAPDPSAPTTATARPAPRKRREIRPPKGRAGRAARLVVLEPKAARGQAYALNREITIGRDTNCTITIPDDTFVSSLHARIFEHEGQPVLEDLGSTNGSYLNGNKVAGIKLLHPGDRVQIGYTVLEAQ
ncbi:MAG TPA: FHA domain-containing protein [Ilumatobacteraceae bacterium]|nr:FHA domain-containing protein [Ilumatobacteraceae bacterium]